MRVVNLIIVLNPDHSKVLMCYRQKDPYKGRYNFVGGKVENNEDHLQAAYRELYEESGITKKDIDIDLLMATRYPIDNLELQVYYGTLKYEVDLKEEINPLVWIDVNSNFANGDFAGDGNIEHMMQCIVYYQQNATLHQ
ncbi:MAG: NUDIX domain-containing protein [Erysipelothrix sp.]|nr:NUDIX domain-containing protein [Erysipelothrix sp.]